MILHLRRHGNNIQHRSFIVFSDVTTYFCGKQICNRFLVGSAREQCLRRGEISGDETFKNNCFLTTWLLTHTVHRSCGKPPPQLLLLLLILPFPQHVASNNNNNNKSRYFSLEKWGGMCACIRAEGNKIKNEDIAGAQSSGN